MKISLLDVDGHKGFPNYALMKLSAWHKRQGHEVDWFKPLFSRPDVLYASKIFTFTKDYEYFPTDCDVQKGGTGYDLTSKLPAEIDAMFPDYSIYPSCDYAIGFLTRGCIRKCKWCVVPVKEGYISQYRSIEQLARQDTRKVVLMDNNFLAADPAFVEEQLQKSIQLRLKLDFNQALDARLVTEKNAKLLAKNKWIQYIRFACDQPSQLQPVERAIRLLRENGYTRDFGIYVLAVDFASTYKRVQKLLTFDKQVNPFVMPFRKIVESDLVDIDPEEIEIIKRLARWCNRVWIRKTCKFEDYKR